MFKWFKKLNWIVHHYDADNKALRDEVYRALKLIRDRTTVHADIHMMDKFDQVIVVGRYRNRDYVRAFPVYPEDLNHLIEMFKAMEARIGRVDVPITCEAVIKREIDKEQL